jgi:hypothetical protein
MRKVILLVVPLLSIQMFVDSFAQDIPFVYDVENTGVNFPPPVLPSFNELPTIQPLTDPFVWSDGSDRDTTFASWSHRRAEINAEIQHYEIGEKPPRPDSITASFTGDTLLTVNVIVNSDTLTLTSRVRLPEGEGPFPVIIGMSFFVGGQGTGSLPSDIFTSRNIARMEFVHNQVTTYGNQNSSDPYYQLYPHLNPTNTGQYSAWAWGVSRLIDGLELVQDSLPIDLQHIAVTGCSYAGKMALFSGALDERVALTIAQESGGGGAPAWRVSETLGNVERLGSTDHNWFKEDMFQFANANVSKLPEDHHELMAMCAPRALLVTGNTDYEWLANPSCYVSARATQRIYNTFGIGDRFGFYIDNGHNHCAIPNSQRPAIEAFVDKFLLGDTTANTNISVNPYDYVDYSRWTEWWGTGDPVFPEPDTSGSQIIYYEPECATIGSNWNIIEDAAASGGKYVTVRPDTESVSAAPTSSDDHIYITFTVDKDSTYYIFGRANCPSPDDDSFWLRMDNGSFSMANGLGTNGWDWVILTSSVLTAGEHTLTIAYRENGALLDKICISDYPSSPEGMGEEAENACDSATTGVGNLIGLPDGYTLGQNYPNPFNPSTEISYILPEQNFVTLKVFDVLGKEVATLVNEEKPAGKYEVDFDASTFSSGLYFYELRTENISITKKMVYLK